MKPKKILKYNPGEKSLKAPHIICVDLECLLEKIGTCQNSQEKSYTEKKAKYMPSGYSLITCCFYDKSKNEREYYRGEDCMDFFFLTAIWLSHGQLWVILEGTASLTRC